ncbi:LytTR family DNA-binding domain-containing protein [Flavihumibacter sp. ZG627]|uniref:LytR/AlgR family response regulator transcription factor n=1 Tax=Flavihumibacter sp. ZG627 TaxID=1463156 RepID=UPI00057CA2D1|nr:response regulator transcription factor [Flavihumibacter sp. ZG627]KIC91660.1 chemotaxis protein CheY [Flavihumibacter sp. ZG627]
MHNLNKSTIQCLIVDDEPLARDVIRLYIEKVPVLHLAGECGNAIDAMMFLHNEKVDLIFLDILMPHLTGTDFVKSLRNIPKVIFTTAYKEYALEGFELNVVDYLLKPIRFDRFLRAVSKAFSQKNEELANNIPVVLPPEKKSNSGFIYMKVERKMIKVMFDDIIYIESARDYLKVITQTNTIITRQTLSSFEAMLSDNEFIRIHRSYIVSLKKINSFTHDTVDVGVRELPLGKFYLNSFLKLQH